uniref:Galanin/GMAp prepropeptide 1A n=1 Tax=Schizothorax richardsonii TaxID=183910 RepID=A0A8T9ISL2_SCHRI|nr:galanin/GMAp prepropeptide 1A [Schizothorax richardsonii]
MHRCVGGVCATLIVCAFLIQLILRMHRCVGGVCATLIVCAFLTETLGMVIAAKEKRGWTLNSAGYLLGPHAIDSHRSLSDKHGQAGKREMPIEEDFKTAALRIADEDTGRQERNAHRGRFQDGSSEDSR